MDSRVQLVFRGEILSGFSLDEVKRHLGELFKVDEARRSHLFSGERVVIRQSLRQDEAERYTQRLAQFGALLHIEPLTVTQPAVPLTLAPVEPVPEKVASITPVLAPTAEEIVCPNCGDRQSKRLLCRSCATDMPMGIAAKLEAEKEAIAARLAERRTRHGISAGAAVASTSAPSIFGFGFQGRLGRLSYATAGAWLLSALYLLILFAMLRPMLARVLLLIAGGILIVFLSIRLSVLRCHDADRSGWWALLLLVPYADLVVGLLMSLMPGTDGDNDFGEPPRRGSWLWFGLALVAVAVTVALTWSAAMTAMARGLPNANSEAEPVPAVSAEFGQELPSPEAAAAFYNEYTPARSPKAFVVSPKGAWGWKAGAASQREAVQEAIASCDVQRPAYTPACRVVNVDGEWVQARRR